MNVCAAPPDGVIVIVACRLALDVFAAADHCTVPPPVPDAPAVMVNHVWLLTAVHGSAASVVVRETEPALPEAPTFEEVGLTTRTPPNWVAVSVTFGAPEEVTVTVAVREAADGLAAAV